VAARELSTTGALTSGISTSPKPSSTSRPNDLGDGFDG
jgi:hypothetical protein